jgi:hypothetical protein
VRSVPEQLRLGLPGSRVPICDGCGIALCACELCRRGYVLSVGAGVSVLCGKCRPVEDRRVREGGGYLRGSMPDAAGDRWVRGERVR